MKRKYAAMVLGLTLALTSMNMAYAADKDTDTAQTTEAAAEDESADAADETASQEVYGEVTEVGEDSITINVGTLKEGQAPDGEKPDDAKDAKDEKADDSKDEKTDDSKDEQADDS